jgi:hypothetical protein
MAVLGNLIWKPFTLGILKLESASGTNYYHMKKMQIMHHIDALVTETKWAKEIFMRSLPRETTTHLYCKNPLLQAFLGTRMRRFLATPRSSHTNWFGISAYHQGQQGFNPST